MGNVLINPDALQLRARLVQAGQIIEALSAAVQKKTMPSLEVAEKTRDFMSGLELDAFSAKMTDDPNYHEAKRLARHFAINSSIIPAGEPRNEDVLWNALMSMREALLAPQLSGRYEQALRDCNEAIQFVRGNQSVRI